MYINILAGQFVVQSGEVYILLVSSSEAEVLYKPITTRHKLQYMYNPHFQKSLETF